MGSQSTHKDEDNAQDFLIQKKYSMRKNEETKEIRMDFTLEMCTIGWEKDVLEVQVQEAAKGEERRVYKSMKNTLGL